MARGRACKKRRGGSGQGGAEIAEGWRVREREERAKKRRGGSGQGGAEIAEEGLIDNRLSAVL